MRTQLAFGSLLLASSQLIAPSALAQSNSGGVPPAGSVVTPTTPQEQSAETPQEQVETSTPGAEFEGTDDIVVIGRNVPNVVRATPQVVSVLSSEDIARTGEGDIAGALGRVTGLSVVGNGFVYVRGLGDRYSSSLLNGSPLPSPEPLRRVVPLDIFPTNVIASSLVQKSYSVNYPGEFGGGVINLTTRAVPKEAFFQVGASISADTITTDNRGLVHDGGSKDWFGYDSGTRKVPDFIRDAGKNRTSVLPSGAILGLTNAETTLIFQNTFIPPNLSFDTSFGGSVDAGGVRLGLIASGGFSNSWRTRDATQQFAIDNDGGLSRDFRTVTTDNRVIVNGLLGLGAEFGEHQVRWTNVYIHDTLKQTSLGTGGAGNNFDVINGKQPFLDQGTAWFERQLFNSQLAGEFRFDDLSVDLRGSYANTKRNAPYERSIRYEYLASIFATPVDDYVSTLSTSSPATVAFSELDETLKSGQADLSYKLNLSFPVALSAGYYYSDTSRDSSRYQFQYFGPGGASLPLVLGQLRPDYLLSDDTILNGCVRFIPGYTNAGNCIELRNTTAASGAAEYSAGLRVHAGYGQIELEPFPEIRATVGVRYEDGLETVNTSGLLNTRLANSYWLPAATITWTVVPDVQLRFHGSKTIARPQFRELAPQLYTDFETTRQFFGNPLLDDSQLYNLEARAEWFFAREQRVTLAGFMKKIDNPIETVAFFPGGSTTPQVGFSYAPSALLYGAEVDALKYFDLDSIGGNFFARRRILLSANYTYSKSELRVGNELVPSPLQGAVATYVRANNLFVDGDPLVGQSDHLFNFQLGLEDRDSLSQLTFLVNYASERVTNRGPVPPSGDGIVEPNFVEHPGWRFDLVARQGIKLFGVDLELKLEGRNLTGRRYEEFQIFPNGVRRDTNTYDLGRTFTAGLSATF
ncbi:TonB-dependent receptor plug domain-containing protein [Sphingomonas sp. M1-B02]|uniref:TonB-dependent receptor plug domain-containing protein n=1 Tax=Sphingomonas sp. M1-B02 TaxID=3114300 RepID=UPI002240B994|nr:TonB-dependent receptor plug domain-containing protein [Sphingomonas sp. S6-11]UZK66465.1 TonB-dependent receptor [Sphingomonas sp. S6-11]